MQTEMHQQVGFHDLPKSNERRPGEATLNTALLEDDPVTPIEDSAQGLNSMGIDRTQFGFDTLNKHHDSWPETETVEPISDPFGVSEAVNDFGDTELFPEVDIDDPLPYARDGFEDFREPLFETGTLNLNSQRHM
jgi:hypothetical protein